MSTEPRPLPEQPSLRYLKLKAKRRLAAGEFGSLHEAQLAVAREHGLPSWSELKRQVEAQPSPDGHARTQVRWLISRFEDADSLGWVAPDEAELLRHFTERFLAFATAERIVQTLARRAEQLRGELVVLDDQPQRIRARVGGMMFEAATEPEPPHRLGGLRIYPGNVAVTDPRVAMPSSRMAGAVPDGGAAIAETAFAEFGLAALVLAAGSREGAAEAGATCGDTAGLSDPAWVVARGWAVLARGTTPGAPAMLDKPEVLGPEHRFAALSVTKLITATVVLRLVADGLAGLDEPANDHLHTVRLANDSVTIRELLSHSGGVDAQLKTFDGAVPDLASLAGPVLSCGGPRGEFSYSNAGYAALGQLVADLTRTTYAEAATGLVLRPLGMTSSSFPAASAAFGADAVSGYELAADGTFTLVPRQVCTMPAAGGLWTTAGDLVRFALSWSSLLPEALRREALTPVCVRGGPVHVGLGWHVNSDRGVGGHAGGGPGGASSLVVQLDDRRAYVAMTNRRMPIEPVNSQVIRALS
jgi:CubicO group peptidase (beta-lactamase class C family)